MTNIKKSLYFIITCLICACDVGSPYGNVNDGIDEDKAVKVSVEYFKNGDVLPPQISTDTLVVKDAEGLNENIADYEQGLVEYEPYQLDSLFKVYCTIKNKYHGKRKDS